MTAVGPGLAEQAGRIMSTVDKTIAPGDSMYGGDEEHYFSVPPRRSALKATR